MLLALMLLASMALVAPMASAADQVTTTVDNVRALSAGENHSMALIGGTLFAWGDGSAGQVGNGKTENVKTPAKIMDDVYAMDAGRTFSAAIDGTGKLYTWGDNSKGQLALGNTKSVTKPTAVNSKEVFIKVSAGHDHLLALTRDGKLYGVGSNAYGQLVGTGDKSSLTLLGTGYKDMFAGRYTTFAITTDDKLMAVGSNQEGQLGLGDFVNRAAFTQVMSGVAAVSGGFTCTFIQTTSGELYVCGKNDSNALGLGSTEPYVNTPRKQSLTIKSIGGGMNNGVAVGTNGQLYTWGAGPYGELGNGTSGISVVSATPISIASNYEYATSGQYHRLALASDGKVYVWGNNRYGQLGNDTLTGLTAPKAITFTGTIVDAPADLGSPESTVPTPKIYTMRSTTQLVKPGETTSITVTCNTDTTIVKVANPSDTEVWGASKEYEVQTRTIGGAETECHVFTVTFPLANEGLYQVRIYAGQIIDGKNKYNNEASEIKGLTVRAYSFPAVAVMRTEDESDSVATVKTKIAFRVFTDAETTKVKITDVEGNILAETTKYATANSNGYRIWNISVTPYAEGSAFYYAFASKDGENYEEAINKRGQYRVKAGTKGASVKSFSVDKFDAKTGEKYTYTVVTGADAESVILYDMSGVQVASATSPSKSDSSSKTWQVTVTSSEKGKFRYYIGAADKDGIVGAMKTSKFTTIS